MNGRSLRLGIMGGTFDPIHFGHLVTAETARHRFGLERVVFVPAGAPPHKRPGEVSAPEHRYRMARLATVTNLSFQVSRIEIDRQGPSYTVDTLRQLAAEHPGHELYFITGADAILTIVHWNSRDELLDTCRFIAATRPGYPLEALHALRDQLGERFQRIEPVEVPALAISSSDIRDRVRRGLPIKYLLPASVESYIVRHGLYREQSSEANRSGGGAPGEQRVEPAARRGSRRARDARP